MQPLAELTTDLLAYGTLLAQLAVVLLVVGLIFRSRFSALLEKVAPFALPVAFIVALVGSVLTFVYSDVFGMAPCGLCWLQRAFLYPMPILLAIGMWARDTGVAKYIFGLAIPGALVALYQHYLQVGGVGIFPCPAVPTAADCAQRMIFEFGYITFPFMSLVAFVLVGVLMLVVMRKSRISAAP